MHDGLRIGVVDAIRERNRRLIERNPHMAWKLKGEKRPHSIEHSAPVKTSAPVSRPVRRNPRGEPTLDIAHRARRRDWSPSERAWIDKAIRAICAIYEIWESEFHSQTRTNHLAEARYTLGWLFRNHRREWGLTAFADLVGRDHTSVMYWIRKGSDLWEAQGEWAARYVALEIHMGVPIVSEAGIALRTGSPPPRDNGRVDHDAAPAGIHPAAGRREPIEKRGPEAPAEEQAPVIRADTAGSSSATFDRRRKREAA